MPAIEHGKVQACDSVLPAFQAQLGVSTSSTAVVAAADETLILVTTLTSRFNSVDAADAGKSLHTPDRSSGEGHDNQSIRMYACYTHVASLALVAHSFPKCHWLLLLLPGNDDPSGCHTVNSSKFLQEFPLCGINNAHKCSAI